ncbi:pentatricopeptide repeat-containing protein At3g20730-like [Malania oleifera]|uniref:pentatricopeptide repeat-containing protein At3g20730-like n=1 Tax=Malania oleifera TaxID=397392 RepID=UPI0025AE150A|nr:pentatricopeptide repeat-containing protein At3g20730-like [Malania oleifera]
MDDVLFSSVYAKPLQNSNSLDDTMINRISASSTGYQFALKSHILSLCNMGRLPEALKLSFSAPFALDYSVYLKTLQLCIDAKVERGGLLIHKHLITSGFDSNLHLNTKLVIFYAKLRDMMAAHKVFDGMTEGSVVSWTALVSGYSQNGYFQEALMVFVAMRRAGLKANQFTYGSVLRACSSMRCLDGGKQIQGCIQKGRFVDNLFVQSALVDLHSKCGIMRDACYIFEMMSKRDVVSWNTLIGGYAVQGFTGDSFQMFRAMLREGSNPDCFTFGSILRALSSGNDLMKISQIHGFIIHLGFGSHRDLMGLLIDTYAKCGSIRIADDLYKNMPEKDLISCTALISGYAREGNCSRDVLNLFKEIRQLYLVMDDVLLCSMLNVCANGALLSLGRQIHALALKYLPRYDVAMGNALIDMYAKSGEIEDANHAFDEMEEKNVISWTSLIAGLGKHGYGQKAIMLYKNMECHGLKPNDVTFLSLLFACSHAGLTGEGWDFFNAMVCKYNILPRVEHYSCMIDLFARGGQLEEAYNIICNMKIKPNTSVWGAFLGACTTYGNMSLGEIAAKQLFSINPENSVSYVALASIYANAGLWGNAWNMRQLMENRSLKKDPGYSLLQSTRKSIEFLHAS